MDETAAIRGVSHLSLSVRDLDRSLTFYRDVLRLPVLQEPTDGVVFQGRQAMLLAGRVAVSLQEHSASDGQPFDPARAGLDHLALHVSNRDALQWWTEHLDGAGVAHSGVREVGGWGWMIELRDPDDIQLELFTRD